MGKRADQFSAESLTRLYNRADRRTMASDERLVIFSDLHMGDGSRNDDFRANSNLFAEVISRHYAPEEFHLILNGDVEELQRFPMHRIAARWDHVYTALATIASRGGITRLVGNHDLDLLDGGPSLARPATRTGEFRRRTFTDNVREALRIDTGVGELFVLHGHQTARRYEEHNHWVRIILRYLANPLGIGNYTVAADSTKQFNTERQVYRFASSQKVLAIIGHTHRPMFQSMSKRDTIQFEIEQLCREYPVSDDQSAIERRIGALKLELAELQAEEERKSPDSLYQDLLLVPCLFNSGCVLGKRGMTCLELEGGVLRLVYWFDENRPQKLRLFDGGDSTPIRGTGFHRVVIKEDSLSYIFSRIALLA